MRILLVDHNHLQHLLLRQAVILSSLRIINSNPRQGPSLASGRLLLVFECLHLAGLVGTIKSNSALHRVLTTSRLLPILRVLDHLVLLPLLSSKKWVFQFPRFKLKDHLIVPA